MIAGNLVFVSAETPSIQCVLITSNTVAPRNTVVLELVELAPRTRTNTPYRNNTNVKIATAILVAMCGAGVDAINMKVGNGFPSICIHTF